MSILAGMTDADGGVNNNNGSPGFHEFKKQASFFLREKIKTARLAFTDVTPAQLLAEEATNGNNPGGPDGRTLKMISKAAFEVDDYCRIVDILHKRLGKFERRNWRASYKALVVLEHLLTHGPDRIADEFQCHRDVITEMENFQHVDEKGFNWGMSVRKKSERILKMLERGPLLKEERDKARKISRGIQGFGSFCHRDNNEPSVKPFDRCNSSFNYDGNDHEESVTFGTEDISLPRDLSHIRIDSKENLAPEDEVVVAAEESKALLSERKDESRENGLMGDDDHPFDDVDHLTSTTPFLSTT